MDTNQHSKTDIDSRPAIELFVAAFYEKLMRDENIGIIFTKIVPIQLEEHLPVIADFWESILLDHPLYKNNAMGVHYAIHEKFPLKQEHFDTWLMHFNNTIDEMFVGIKTDLAKKRAKDIAALMFFKMNSFKI